MEYESLFKAARKAGTALADVEPERLGRILQHAARLLRGHTPALLEANARDIEAMPASSPMLDRLRLTPERIGSIASDMEAVSHLRSPQGEELARWTRPNGMTIVKRRVPFGVVGMVCEARPNVTADIFALCVKTGNACVLKGGSDARHSNEAIAALLHEALGAEGIDENTFTLLPAGHEAVGALLSAVGYVDVVIPRGGAGLIRFVRENARIPVIETGAGIVHTYFDIDGDLEKGRAVVCNAKTRRVSVCNALDCLVIHRGRLTDLPELCAPLAGAHVTVYADEEAFAALDGHYPAGLLEHAAEEHFGTEFLDYKLAVKTVASLDGALAHIARYSSRHSEAIVTADAAAVRAAVEELTRALKREYRVSDPNLSVSVETAEAQWAPMDAESTRRVVTLLTCTPFGVQTMSQDMPGLVQTSLNLGIMYTDEDRQVLRASIRSSVATQKKAVLDQLICLTEQLGGTTEAEGDYPGWEYMPQSPLRERMVEVYQEQYGKEPTIKAMHAGVECGLFSEKLPGLDCVSFGPELSDIHTPRERMHIASVQRTWELVKEVLKRSK